jgi:protein gp37
MADKSKIEWTDASWNPVTGCTKVSAGCQNCYAERMHVRLRAMGQEKYLRGRRGFNDLRIHPEELERPLHWKKPRRIFVCSMSDLFHNDVPENFILRVLRVCERSPQHTFQILTKRPERAEDLLLRWPDNVWMGVSIENAVASRRAMHLVRIGAALRFVSFEPLIGWPTLKPDWWKRIHWAIVGGETGPGHRPMDLLRAREIRDACRAYGIPFFMKQMAGKQPIPKDLQIREFPARAGGGAVTLSDAERKRLLGGTWKSAEKRS